MTVNSLICEALFKEYDQIKQEIRTALDIYEKLYGPLIAVTGAISGILAASNVSEADQAFLYSIIPVLILGILGIVWYGHFIALARLSARLEIIEFRLSIMSGDNDLLNWQSHWEGIGRSGFHGKWQELLAIFAMLPSFVIYVIAAWKATPWWAESINLTLPSINKTLSITGTLSEKVSFFIYMLVIILAFGFQFWYMIGLKKKLKSEVYMCKKHILEDR